MAGTKISRTVNAAPDVISKKNEFWVTLRDGIRLASQLPTPATMPPSRAAFSHSIVRSAPSSGSGFRRRSRMPSMPAQISATNTTISSASHLRAEP
ncbi:hypothetical protein AZG88_33830 [Rhodococcus sp. LB1]|nr:hypothetical protein AZG88_33830 [Rhodococcus sp. LB1]